MKHKSVRLSGEELLDRMETGFFGEFHRELECPGMPDVAAFDAAAARDDDAECDRLWEQARDAVAAVDWVVSWDDCVTFPRFNGDAWYRWVERAKK